MIRARVSTAFLLLAVVALWSPLSGNAQDRIWIEPKPTTNQSDWYPAAIQIIDAKIVQFDAKELRCLVADDDDDDDDDDELVFSSSQVIWIEPISRPEIQVKAIEQFHAGQYRDALQSLPKLLQQRPPIWHQQSLTMMAAVAASRSDQNKVALELVARLDRRSLPSFVVAWLPIQWQNQPMKPEAVANATSRLDDSSELVRLTAASLLLSSTKRKDALAALESLKRSKRREIGEFAKILQWRVATPPQVKESSVRWQQKIDRLPMVLQTGPTLTLIDKLRSAGLADRAKHLQWSLDQTPIHPYP